MDRLKGMQVFRAVLDHGGFARGAEQVGLSAASASRVIAELEAHLGTRLLHRTTRSLSPTDEGRAYYERCVAILDQIDETERSLRESRMIPTGTLRVTASPALGALALWPILPEFSRAHPRLRLDLFLDDRVVDVVREGYDVALRLTSGELRDSTLVARRIRHYRELLVASPAYLQARGEPRTPADLGRHDVLCWARTSQPVALDLSGERVVVDGPVRSDSTLVQRSAALADLGIAVLPEYAIGDDLDAGRLVAVLPEHEPPGLDLWALHPPAGALAARVRAFVDHVAAKLGPGVRSRP